eukprot:6196090-Pleurochrysis_carterae.AAC.2
MVAAAASGPCLTSSAKGRRHKTSPASFAAAVGEARSFKSFCATVAAMRAACVDKTARPNHFQLPSLCLTPRCAQALAQLHKRFSQTPVIHCRSNAEESMGTSIPKVTLSPEMMPESSTLVGSFTCGQKAATGLEYRVSCELRGRYQYAWRLRVLARPVCVRARAHARHCGREAANDCGRGDGGAAGLQLELDVLPMNHA